MAPAQTRKRLGALMLSFNDVFYVLFLAVLVVVPVILLLKPSRARTP